jgi:transcriptional regulator with XRE-family HTH domain
VAETTLGEAFGAQLRQSRQAAGLSLRQLAGRIGYDHSYLAQVERGQRPGSADLARLCDRELGTGCQLIGSYMQTPRRRTAAPSPQTDPLELAWQELRSEYGAVDQATACGDPHTIPPRQLVPELVRELRLLQSRGPTSADSAATRSARLCVLIAETLTALGEPYTARRWWWAGRTIASESGADWLHSEALIAEATSGLAEHRPLPRLLELADEGLVHARPGAALQAHAVRAQVFAAMGEKVQAHRSLEEVLSCSDALPSANAPLPHQVHGTEGRVCASLGYGTPGCLMLSRALELCPPDRLGELARLELALAECLAVEGEVPAGLALTMRVLVELPDEWHTFYLYDDADRVLAVAQDREPGLPGVRDLQVLLERKTYLSGRSVGGGSWAEAGRG